MRLIKRTNSALASFTLARSVRHVSDPERRQMIHHESRFGLLDRHLRLYPAFRLLGLRQRHRGDPGASIPRQRLTARHTRCEQRIGTGRSVRVTNTHYTPAKRGSLLVTAASRQQRQRRQGTCHHVPRGWFRADSLLRPCSSQGYPEDSTTTGVTPPVVAFLSPFSKRSRPT